jgi:4-hydroxy-3-polyprenylbenzoate decarboxylase/2,5-furandicarboxylate decarboxylase 1
MTLGFPDHLTKWELSDAFREAYLKEQKPIPHEIVEDGPIFENIITGDAIDLSALPVPKYSPDDGGPYITAGIVVSQDPKTGIPDIGHYRFEIIDKQTMSFNPLPMHRLGKHIAKARAMGHTTFRAALVLGPAVKQFLDAFTFHVSERFHVLDERGLVGGR